MLIISSNQHKWSSRTPQRNVPLKHITIEAHILGFAADVVITQIYQNNEDQPIEAVYCFPIEEQAAVYSFKAILDDREIIAQLKEKKVAQQEYIDALKRGDGAYLMEQDEKSQDNFVVNVGALPPSKECKITIAYVTELQLIKGSTIQFVLPTTIAPRYSSQDGGISAPAGTTSKYVQTAPYTIDLRCRVDKMGERDAAFIARIDSSSHPIQVDFSRQDEYLITFARENTHLDRDILVNIELSSKRSSSIVAAEPGAVMAVFTPSLDECRQAVGADIQNEFIFVIDCSGSMQSEDKIGLARESMKLFLKSLPLKCYFNIVRFGSSFKCLFSNVVEIYDEKTVKQAEKLIETMQADLGGTELYVPLEWLSQSSPSTGRSRQIFLLTDGEISDVNRVLKLCQSTATSTRIFSFGLGHSPSRSLVKGLARTTNGRFVFVPPGSKVDVYVGEQLEKALQPSIVDTEVIWNVGFEVNMAPRKLPPVYANDRLVVYGLAEDKSARFSPQSSVEVRLQGTDRVISCAKIDRIPLVSDKQTLARLAAKALILELQHEKDQPPEAKKCSGSLQTRFESSGNKNEVRANPENNEDQRKTKIIELSLRYNILSPHTAFVAVEKRIDGNNSGMVLREVPLEISVEDKYLISRSLYQVGRDQQNQIHLGASSDHIKQMSKDIDYMDLKNMMCDLISRGTELSHSINLESRVCYSMDLTNSSCDSMVLRSMQLNESMSTRLMKRLKDTAALLWHSLPSPTLSPSNDDIVRDLIDQQKFDGLWTEDEKLTRNLTKKDFSCFRKIAVDIDPSILMTIIVIAVLEQKFSNYSSLWFGVVLKARSRVTELLQNDKQNMEEILNAVVKEL